MKFNKKHFPNVHYEIILGISYFFLTNFQNQVINFSILTHIPYSNISSSGDGMANHNNMQFSTKNRNKIDCATTYKGAWWYNSCHQSNLNGLYLNGSHSSFADGIEWYQWKGVFYSMKTSTMIVRRK